MSGMVERVTRAIEVALDAEGNITVSTSVARAAIAAMREPTGAMIGAGAHGILSNTGFTAKADAKQAWHAMIDAALAEP